jgi:hypothetical protein
MMDAGFSGSVHRTLFEGDNAEVGADVDDASTALGNHHPGRRQTGKENALQGGVHGLVVFFFGDVQCLGRSRPPGVVDEDVDASELRLGTVH